ncbi:DUF6262 family protein [Clostridium perfringens]|uniref:Transposase n=1 Tax=Clostridium perfringens TaxID=1502 RepID=A0A133N0U8_CLOPF|nr:DUF6262 family protein [Clostridium perfringens]KXA09928.1 hypothetical protein HMPREF3222_02248 [Clostridium perfringens]MBS5921481.1 hypothetical protein [Clostridium perfringens]
MGNKNPNTTEIIRLKKQESDLKKQAVLSVLKELELLDDALRNPISKAEICRRAGVSKTFLYTYKDELLDPINKAINKQNKKMKVISQKQTFTETSKDRVIESLKRRIQSLEDENKKLKNDNAILLGKLAQK